MRSGPVPCACASSRCLVKRGSRTRTSAGTVLRDVCVFADRLAASLGVEGPDLVVDDALVTLLPGERHVFRVTRRDGGAIRSSTVDGQALDLPVRSFGEVTG